MATSKNRKLTLLYLSILLTHRENSQKMRAKKKKQKQKNKKEEELNMFCTQQGNFNPDVNLLSRKVSPDYRTKRG